jgi:hypothetical protein
MVQRQQYGFLYFILNMRLVETIISSGFWHPREGAIEDSYLFEVQQQPVFYTLFMLISEIMDFMDT